jgi:hypothetical protein
MRPLGVPPKSLLLGDFGAFGSAGAFAHHGGATSLRPLCSTRGRTTAFRACHRRKGVRILQKEALGQRSASVRRGGNRSLCGRPLLIVLENYVLDCIGELQQEKQVLARSVVQLVWNGGDDWKATVREQLHLEATMDQALRDMWSRNQELAKQQNQLLHPVQFAKMVVDQNFASLIG